MPYEIVIPRLGLTMESGRLVEWYKDDGAAVEEGEPLFAIETDKAIQEIEAPTAGVVHQRPDVLNTELPIGTLIGYIAQPDETINWKEVETRDAGKPEGAATSTGVRSQPAVHTTDLQSDDEQRASPAARRRAAELGIDWHVISGSSRDGHVLLADVERVAAETERGAAAIKASPVARRVASELDVDLAALATQYPDKRLTRKDVERAAATEPTPSPAVRREPMTRLRQVTAERMANSVRTTAPVTLTTEVDATELVRLRTQLKDDASAALAQIPTYTDLLTKLVSQALTEHPALNSRLDGEDIVMSDAAHIGIAVDTDRGLLVPVLRDAGTKGVREIARESADLIERTRDGRIAANELRGSTFTITNLGMYEVDAFTPIINMPECAILGIGRIVPKQVVVDVEAQRVAIRQMMFLSLTFDHRLVDGAPAARFLQRVKQLVEQPYLWLIT